MLFLQDCVYTSIGVGGRGFLDPLRRDVLDVKPVNNNIIYICQLGQN